MHTGFYFRRGTSLLSLRNAVNPGMKIAFMASSQAHKNTQWVARPCTTGCHQIQYPRIIPFEESTAAAALEFVISYCEIQVHIDFSAILSTMSRASSTKSLPPPLREKVAVPNLSIRKRKSPPRNTRTSGSSKSLQKALRILLHLGEYGPEMGITQLAGELRLNKTTVYRLLNAMAKFEFIEKNSENETYRLGLRLHLLGCRALESRSLSIEAHRFLVELSRRCNESVSIAVPGPGGIICLDRVDSLDSVITARTPVGARFFAHCTAVGKAILAYLPQSEADAIIKRDGMMRFTDRTISKYSQLLEELALTRHRGYAVDSGELEKGLSGFAATVFMRGSQPVAAVGIAGPTQRFMGEESDRKIALVRDFAARISKALGRRKSELPSPGKGQFYDPFSWGET